MNKEGFHDVASYCVAWTLPFFCVSMVVLFVAITYEARSGKFEAFDKQMLDRAQNKVVRYQYRPSGDLHLLFTDDTALRIRDRRHKHEVDRFKGNLVGKSLVKAERRAGSLVLTFEDQVIVFNKDPYVEWVE